MKTCTNCKRELPTSLDEFGNPNEPLCLDCFLTPELELEKDEADTIEALEEEIEELEGQIEDLRSEIYDLEEEIRSKKDEIRKLRGITKNQYKNIATEYDKLTAWKLGLPKVVSL